MSSLVWKGIRAPIDPLIVVYTKTSLPPATSGTLVILKLHRSQILELRDDAWKAGLRCNDATDVVVHQQAGFVSSPLQVALFVHNPGTRWVVIYRAADVVRETVDKDVSKLISTRHSFVVHHLRGRDPSRLCVIGKDQELSCRNGFVRHEKCRFLNVSDHDSCSLDIQSQDSSREGLQDGVMVSGLIPFMLRDTTHVVLALSQQLLFTEFVKPQSLTDTGSEMSLESSQRHRNFVHRSLP